MNKKLNLPVVQALCDEFEITIIPTNRYPGPMETRATAALEGILRNCGEPHLRVVLSTLTEAGAKGALLDGPLLWATSDLVLACADWIESDPSSWFDAWDTLPVGEIMWLLRDTRSVGRMRNVRFGALYLLLQNHRGGLGLADVIRDGVDRKLFELMHREGTESGYLRETSATLGRTIMAAEKLLPSEAFPGWLANECGLTVPQARRYVKRAQEDSQGQKVAA